MTPREYLELFRERWRAILAGLLLGIAVAVGIVVTATPLYAAQVTLFVSAGTSTDPSAALDRNQLSSQRMQTYAQLITSDRVAGDVVQSLGLPMTGPELATQISASSQPETVLLDATVTDEDPIRAATIANTLAEQFISAVEDLEQPSGVPGDAVVSARVFEDAVPPTEPEWPRPMLTVAIGALLGLLAGLGLAVLRRALGTAITNRRLLGSAVPVPVLGVIARRRRSKKQALVVRDDQRGPDAESYRQLRTNLQFVDVDRAHKVVMLTSPSPGDGTTTVLANLACTMAEAGQRVIVVEADLRRPRVADVLGAERTTGLSNVLAQRAEPDEVVQRGTGGVDVVAGGPIPPNPGQLLASPRMVQVLDELRPAYDVVLVDASPLLPVADATLLAPLVDGVVLVVRSGTPAHRVEAARETLDAVSARLLGTILTRARGRAARSDHRYASAAPVALSAPAEEAAATTEPDTAAESAPTEELAVTEGPATATDPAVAEEPAAAEPVAATQPIPSVPPAVPMAAHADGEPVHANGNGKANGSGERGWRPSPFPRSLSKERPQG